MKNLHDIYNQQEMKKKGIITAVVLVVVVMISLLVPYNQQMLEELTNAFRDQREKIEISFIDISGADKNSSRALYLDVKDSNLLTPFEKQNAFGTNMKNRFIISGNNKVLKNTLYTITYKNSKSDVEFVKEYIDKLIKDNNVLNLTEEEQLYFGYKHIIDKYSYNYTPVSLNDKPALLQERNMKKGLLGTPVVCDAYAMWYSLYLDALNMDNHIVRAEVLKGNNVEAHAWNMVKTKQGWYYIDPTWGDNPNKSVMDSHFLKTYNDLYQKGYKYIFLDNIPKGTNTPYQSIEEENTTVENKPLKENINKPENKPIDNSVKNPVEKPTEKPIDIPEKESKHTININKDVSYISGYKDNTFRGNNNITREEAVKVINNIITNDIKESNNTFVDVSSKRWSYKDIEKIASLNIINGYKNNLFKPEKNITRAEALKISLSLLNIDIDNNTKGHWAQDYIDYGLKNNIVKGYEDGSFRPDNNITRAEFVIMINNVLDRSVEDFNITELKKTNKIKDIKNTWYEEQVLIALNKK